MTSGSIRMLITITTILPLLASTAAAKEHVILLHGLCRTSHSMHAMAQSLAGAGYTVLNVAYPSRTASIEKLSEAVIGQAVAAAERQGATRIHFVAHSLGAMLIRSYFNRHELAIAGHVVMLGPPNQGSEVVDKLGSWWLFKKINGPAGGELGTALTATPNQLGPAKVSTGVIAGKYSINWINSLMIPGSDDGKVSVERTKLAGMADHIVLRTAHPFLMRDASAIKQTIRFLREGRFEHKANDTSARINPNLRRD
jgi:triacylglycerol lipase